MKYSVLSEALAPKGMPWLARLLFAAVCVALVTNPTPAPAERRFVGAEKCKVCHGKQLMGDQHAAWQLGPHGQAVKSLSSNRADEIAKGLGLSKPASASPQCLRCHSTADRIDQDLAAYEIRREHGVQCESCHGPGHDYRKKKIMSDKKESAAAGLWPAGRDASICTTCHNAKSPTFDESRYVLEDGSQTGFDFDQARARIRHSIPAHVKGHYVELEREEKEKARKAKR